MRPTRPGAKVAVATLAALLLGVLAVARADDPGDEDGVGGGGGGPGPAEGDDDDGGGDDDDDGSSCCSPGGETMALHYAPCWISARTGPSMYREVIAGAAVGEIDTAGAPYIWQGTSSVTVTFGLTDTYDWVDQDPWAAGGLNFPITTPSTTGISTYYKYILRTTVQPTGSLAVFTEQTGCFGFTT